MSASTYKIDTRCDSSVELGIDPNYNRDKTYTLKRTFSDASLSWTEPSKSIVKKVKTKNKNTCIGDNQQHRVLCPIYRRDPDQHVQAVSCYVRGFEAMSRLKQHLVQVHGVSKILLNFKNKQYSNLGTIEAKWNYVFRNLFPNVSDDDIPSPCK